MKKLISSVLVAAGALLAQPVFAAGASIHMDPFPAAKLKDLAALQNGARIFANHCLNCHSANLMRWNRLRDIGLTEGQIREFLIFGDQKVGEPMKVAIDPKDAKAWFGKTPPDLSVITRARHDGANYLYSLLTGYTDPPEGETAPGGATNLHYNPYFAGGWISMPPQLVPDRVVYEDGTEATPEQMARDITAFLAWAGEPKQVMRKKTGFATLIYLLILGGLLYAAYRQVWRDVKH